ncbi:MAG: regulatory protein GemA [Rhodospirillaceae bacterium]
MMPATRRKLIAAVHVAAKAHGLDEDTYRDKIALVTDGGTRSASGCTDAQLRRVLDAINGAAAPSARRAASTPIARKARALWLSAYHLGLVSDPSESALRTWVKRQKGVDDPAWVRAGDADAVITALKQMLKQRAGVDWRAAANPRRCVLSAQWRILAAAGKAPAACLADVVSLVADDAELQRAIAALGQRIRGIAG